MAEFEGPFWGKRPDAIVYSLTGTALSAVSLTPGVPGLGLSGIGPQFSYDILWFPNDPYNYHTYRAVGGAIGSRGYSGSIELGAVWDCPTPDDYTKNFVAANAGISLPGMVSPGSALESIYAFMTSGGRGPTATLFYSPEDFNEGAYGFSFGWSQTITGSVAPAVVSHSTSATYFWPHRTIPVGDMIVEGLDSIRESYWSFMADMGDFAQEVIDGLREYPHMR